MSSVCFYFEVHQPYRVKRLRRSGAGMEVFDDASNDWIINKVAQKCYLPTNALLLELIEQYKGAFKISFAITGVALQQMELYCPDVLDSFVKLAKTGCVEFVGETYYHSLSALYDEQEFKEQVQLHTQTIQRLFGCTPTVFRNTELIYDDRIGRLVSGMGFKGIISEGPDDIVGWRSPNFVYTVPGTDTRLLMKNYKLSDDVAFRFSNRAWDHYPLSADRYAQWLHAIDGNGETVNLFMDYETFGEHQWADSGIFEFMRALPKYVLAKEGWGFKTPSETIQSYESKGDMPFHRLTSWADTERDITAWRGNRMQDRALRDAYARGPRVKASGDGELLHMWRKLLTSDHFYYMCTKWFADGDVHAYFSPYENPYDAFMFYMAGLKKLDERLSALETARDLVISEGMRLEAQVEIETTEKIPLIEQDPASVVEEATEAVRMLEKAGIKNPSMNESQSLAQ